MEVTHTVDPDVKHAWKLIIDQIRPQETNHLNLVLLALVPNMSMKALRL